MKQISVLLVEDHTVVREGFREMLERETDLKVVGEAQDGRRAVLLARTLRPAVVLMDIAMPLLNGLEATRQILKASPSIKVLVLTAHGDDSYIEGSIASGAVGFLLKQTTARDVCRAIREVHNGKTFFGPSISRRLARIKARSPDRAGLPNRKAAQLSSRELEVLQLIAEGKANKQTAAELGIGLKTVEKHREHLAQKLDIHDTANLTRYAIAAGIIESSVQSTIAARAFSGLSRTAASPITALTDREFEIFQLIGHGNDTHTIASQLNISVKTVETHRVHLKVKLQLKNATELVCYAARWTEARAAAPA
jgi:DNA-binding NarL/FixJ family response regulator